MAEAILNQPQFQNADKAREYLEALRWPNGAICPHCGSVEAHYKLEGKAHRAGLYKCSDCREQFTVTVGTLFADSKVALNKWLQACYLMAASKKWVSSKQLERMLGVSYKTAWFMSHRIREAMTGEGGGAVEVDETYWGNVGKQQEGARGWAHKMKVVSLVERDALLAAVYEEDGAVDGLLEKVDGHGTLQFVVYDIIDRRAVKCEFTNEQLPQALSSFQQRVEVIGRVKYRKDGMPVSIKATRIVNYPNKADIPTLAQMRELLSGGANT